MPYPTDSDIEEGMCVETDRFVGEICYLSATTKYMKNTLTVTILTVCVVGFI